MQTEGVGAGVSNLSETFVNSNTVDENCSFCCVLKIIPPFDRLNCVISSRLLDTTF